MKTNTQGLYQSTDYEMLTCELTTLDGRTYNIAHLVPTMNIYEDMDTPFMTASMGVRDALGFVNQKITGGEKVTVAFKTKTASEKYTFRKTFTVYEVSMREQTKPKEIIWQLELVSEEYNTNLNTKISRSFKKKPASDIIKDILSNDLESTKKYNCETDSTDHTYVMPFMHPMEIITFFKNRSVNASGDASFFFFENRDGFVFKSVEKLLEEDSIDMYYVPSGLKHNFPKWNVVDDYWPVENAWENIHTNLKSGQEGTHGTYLDIVDKTVTEQGSNRASQFFMVYSSDNNNLSTRWLENRVKSMGKFYNVVYSFSLGGSTLRTVGDVVNFNLLAAQVTANNKSFDNDNKLHGRYIIRKIRHVLEGTIYKQVVEVVKIME